MNKFLVLTGILSAGNLWASNVDVDFDYSAGAEFYYSDSPDTSGSKVLMTKLQDGSDETDFQGGNRSLGLRRAFLDLQFSHRFSYLRFRIRPDASLTRNQDSTQVQFDVDTRSGNNYRRPAALKLLDTYELGILKTENLSLSYGITEFAYQDREVYLSPLEFGLRVWFPRKFSSLRVSWDLRDELGSSLEAERALPNYSFSLFTLEDTDDRSEKLSVGDKTADTAPVGADAYTGGGFTAGYFAIPGTVFEVFLAFLDSKVDFGRKNRIMGAFSSSKQFSILGQRLAASYGLRYSRERWNVSQGNFPKLEQYSQSLKLSYQLTSDKAIFTGFGQGVSEQPLGSNFAAKEIHTGYQLELGVRVSIYEHLSMSLVLTDELRDIEEAGVKNGGFVLEGETVNRLNRFGVELNYLVM